MKVSAAQPAVRLELVNRGESVEVVFAALAGVVEGLGLDALDADAIQTAVAEACKNVVLHAYEGTEGPMLVEIRAAAGTVEVTVADHGIGIRPHVGERRGPHNGLGLPIIHRHAWRVTYTNVPGGGTELRMEFPVASGAGDPHPEELAAAVLGNLLGPLEGAADARAEVLVATPEGADALLDALRGRLGGAFSRVNAERSEEGGAGQALSLSLSSGA